MKTILAHSCVLSLLALALTGAEALAQDPVIQLPAIGDADRGRDDGNRGRDDDDRDREQDGAEAELQLQRPAPPREGGIPRGEIQLQPDSRQSTDEGMPSIRSHGDNQRVQPYVIPRDDRWLLGVSAYNTDTGVVITRVVPDSAAAHVGLERGDRLVTVDGLQVGWIQDRLYPLGDELQRRAGPHGRVTLLVQNVRNNELLNLDVQLQRTARDRIQ